ncbi:MAG TPA: NAD-dependent epimerase/dehydratase family protein [Clostridia bacterium]
MKKILITGTSSYIGTSVEKWLARYPDRYQVKAVDLKDHLWKEKDFSGYDAVFCLAGIAHVSYDPHMKYLYYKVNCDLAIEAAKKAKSEEVKQFIFMSSAIVYGDSGPIGKMKIITKDTQPDPSNFYGKSKFEADKSIRALGDDHFKTVILRPPMIYGKGCKGNYPLLSKYARKLPVFPDIENARSMLYIENLCEFVRLIIDNEESGIFFPQNAEHVKTSEMVKMIAEVHGKKIHLTKIFNWILRKSKSKVINKVFGNLAYDLSMSEYDKGDYRIRDFRESITRTEL